MCMYDYRLFFHFLDSLEVIFLCVTFELLVFIHVVSGSGGGESNPDSRPGQAGRK